MADEKGDNQDSIQYGRWTTLAIGVATFIVGMGLLISVFGMAKATFESVDQKLAAVKMAAPVKSPAAPSTNNTTTNENPPAAKARPGGPTLAVIAAGLGLKLFGLLVMGWIAAMIAARGAGLAAGALCREKS